MKYALQLTRRLELDGVGLRLEAAARLQSMVPIRTLQPYDFLFFLFSLYVFTGFVVHLMRGTRQGVTERE